MHIYRKMYKKSVFREISYLQVVKILDEDRSTRTCTRKRKLYSRIYVILFYGVNLIKKMVNRIILAYICLCNAVI